MSTVTWNEALQGVQPITGGQPLPPATYRLRLVGGEGRNNSSQAPMLSLQFEVASGPLAGRKAFHNENLPKGNTDQDKQRMGFFLGLMEAFGVTGDQLAQMFAGRSIDADSVDYLAKALVSQGRTIKGTCRPQKNDETRINWGGWIADDGIEPEPPKAVQNSAPPVGPPSAPNGFGGPPNTGLPQGGFPQAGGFPPVQPGPSNSAPGNFQPAAPAAQAPSQPQQQNGLPLGGFPGSGGMQPTPAPDWATQQPVQGQAPQTAFAQVAQPEMQQLAAQQGQAFAQAGAPGFGQQLPGPGQAAPAAQSPAAGMSQFAQPGAAQFPLPGQPGQQLPAAQEGFPGQQFPGQVNPAAFPPPGAQPPQANI